MKPIKIAVMGGAEIAFRRFMPALLTCDTFEYVGMASKTEEKRTSFYTHFQGKTYNHYEELLEIPEIDAIYLPLPPSFHYDWGKKVLEAGKHLFIEKPCTTTLDDSKKLVHLAREKNLALHENYMFLFHPQLLWMKKQLDSGELGEFRLLRSGFSFPRREKSDFRYDPKLGGGALLDCGGYPLALVQYILGDSCVLTSCNLQKTDDFQVDMFGSASFSNKNGHVAQVNFGMDNIYDCSLELMGSSAALTNSRIFTAPPDFIPTINKKTKKGVETIKLDKFDSFTGSINSFYEQIQNESSRESSYQRILQQAALVESVSKSL